MRERVDLKSPVREYRPPGSVRGAPGNRRPYLDNAEAESKAAQSHLGANAEGRMQKAGAKPPKAENPLAERHPGEDRDETLMNTDNSSERQILAAKSEAWH